MMWVMVSGSVPVASRTSHFSRSAVHVVYANLPRLHDSSCSYCQIPVEVKFDMYLLPPEVLILIFRDCEHLSQACALARASSYTYRVWKDCRSKLAGTLASREVVAFDDAVMAVCATIWPQSLRY